MLRLRSVSRLRSIPRLEFNALALMATTIASAGLGLVFWAVAARLFDVHQVGSASAMLSTAILVATICQLNFTNLFPRFIPAAGIRTRRFVLMGYGVTTALSLLAATVFVLTPFGQRYVIAAPWGTELFVVAVGILTLFVLKDAVLTGLRATAWVPFWNVTMSVAKLAVLPLLAVSLPALGIVAAWVGPLVIAVVFANIMIFRTLIPRHMAASGGRADLPGRREFVVFAAAEYGNGLVVNIVPLVLPMLVILQLGPTANAYFYISWIINSALNTLVVNITMSLMVEAATYPERAYALFKRGARLAYLVAIPGALIQLLLAPFILGLIGHEYAVEGATVSRLLAVAALFNVVNLLFACACRIDRTVGLLLIVQLVTAVSLLGVAFTLMPHLGVDGVGLAYVITQGTVGLVLLVPLLRRVKSMRYRAGRRDRRAPRGRASARAPRPVAAMAGSAPLSVAGVSVAGSLVGDTSVAGTASEASGAVPPARSTPPADPNAQNPTSQEHTTMSIADRVPHEERRATDRRVGPPGGGRPTLPVFNRFGPLLVLLGGAVALAMPLVTHFDLDFPGRVALALLYLLIVPGLPAALALRLPNPLASLALVLGISISAMLLVANFTLLWGWFDVVGAQLILSGLYLVLGALVLTQPSTRPTPNRRRADRRAPAPPEPEEAA